jgi:predicted ATPase/DNA-binding SARP family transcriptional activator
VGLTYGVLGPLEVRDGDRLLPVTRAKDRLLLTTLLIHANQVVSTDRLVDVLWGGSPPASGLKALQFHISSLRNVLSPSRTGHAGTCVQTRPPGYVLVVACHDVDAGRFRQLVDDARAVLSYDPVEAHRWLTAALSLWRGPAHGELTFARTAHAEIHRLEEERVAAIEMLHTAELALDRLADAVPRLAALVTEYPYRERLHALLITALYRSGRQADALEVCHDLRRRLLDELGIDPSPELAALETDVLLHSDSLVRSSSPTHSLVRTVNVPSQLTPFIGRIRELAQITGLIQRHRLVTVVGTGGSGKTRLAIEAALRLPNTQVDRVVFVDLAAVTDDALVDLAVLAALGSSDNAYQSARDSLVDHLAEQRVLILLDNCEHLAGAAASIAGHILSNTAAVRMLATSQHVLKLPGETVYAIPPMATSTTSGDPADLLSSEAGTLFLDRAQRARSGFVPSETEATRISTIVRDLEGIPLAIELAAARTRMMTIADVATGLSHRLRLLTDGSPTIRRQQTLEAAVAWSYELTQGRERELFDRVSIFAGSFTHRAAAQVGQNDDPIDVIELLGRLVDKSLITVDASGDEIRYRLLETLRLFGAARLHERGESIAVADRHARHHLDLARQGNVLLRGPDQGLWQRRFRQTMPDLRKGLDHAIKHHPATALSAVADGLGYYLIREASYAEGIDLTERVLNAASSAPSGPRAGVLTLLANHLHFGGRVDEAREVVERAVAMAREVGDPTVLGAALSAAGVAAWGSGRLRDAIASFEEAANVLVAAGQPAPAAVLWNIGISYLDLADVGGAEKTARRLRDAHTSDGDPVLSMNADFLDANVAMVRGELYAAHRLAESALERATELDRPFDIAEVHERLAEICGLRRDLGGVDRHLALADATRADLSPQHQSRANLVRARRALDFGDLDGAQARLQLVLPVALGRQQPVMLSSLFHETARVAFAMGKPTDAAVLTGAVIALADHPEVTLATFITEQARELGDDLVSSLGREESEHLLQHGATLDAAAIFEIVRHCLEV